jgi:hypothetical protein
MKAIQSSLIWWLFDTKKANLNWFASLFEFTRWFVVLNYLAILDRLAERIFLT